MWNSSFPRSNVLVLGSDSVLALLPSTLISQADALLESHRIEDAASLAEQQRKKLSVLAAVNEHEADELRYVYQRLGFQCLTETLFDDAGKHLFMGELDPRILISYYPELRGALFSDLDSLDVFAGVEQYMPQEDSIDEIIAANLVRNYSPHLTPNTREAPPTVELREILSMTARDMLEVYLRKWRTKLKMREHTERASEDLVARVAVDTVIAKLFVAHDKLSDLDTLINEPNYIVLPELEPSLISSHRYASLCKLYRKYGEDAKLLDSWAKLVDGEWADNSIQDPLSSMFSLLNERKDRAMIQQWSLWLTKRDPDRGLKLLTSLGSGKRTVADEKVLLHQLQETDTGTAIRYLEHLVLQKRSTDPDLQMQLATVCVDQLLACAADESTSKLWRAKASSYASSRTETSFLSYFASTTPDSASKRTRLKTILFLQGSTLYEPIAIRQRLVEQEKLLKLEVAIVDGRLGEHRSALTSLVHELHDTVSAEVYCTLGGVIVPEKIAQSLGERFDLQSWASLLLPPVPSKSSKSTPAAVPMNRLVTVDADLKRSLIRVLLEVYMNGGEETSERIAQFLNAQAMNLDVVDVITLIPPNWPLHILSTFVARSLRRTLHARHEGQIVKAISAGQNLAVAERSRTIFRQAGALIEEAVDGDDGTADDSEKLDEKDVGASFDEKVALQASELHDAQPVTDIVAGVGEDEHTKEAAVAPPDPGSDVEVGT